MSFDWTPLLQRWNELLLADEEVDLSAEWAGYPGATDQEFRKLEKHLRVQLPPSYRTFLQCSNGWQVVGPESIYPGPLLAAQSVGWLRELSPDTASVWSSVEGEDVSDVDHCVYDDEQDCVQFRAAYVSDCLQISEGGVNVFLLNPHVRTHEDEWEAWHLASYFPGAVRYRSFRSLIEDVVEGYGHWR